MVQRTMSNCMIENYARHLVNEEKSGLTIQKYLRDIQTFLKFAEKQPITKELTIAYKQDLIARNYAVSSVNSMLAALNGFLDFLGWHDCKIKVVRTQRKIYCAEDKELTKTEYLRLLAASKNQPQLNLIIQTICATGIRISELQFFTLEAIKRGEVRVRCKNKTRLIFVPGSLRTRLMNFAKQHNVTTGAVFVIRSGKPLDRSNIWTQMKNLCQKAQVNPKKVFPHNLRKLFARTFYSMEKDIAKLADILGHGSIETTRIYIMSTGAEHRRQIERMGLII